MSTDYEAQGRGREERGKRERERERKRKHSGYTTASLELAPLGNPLSLVPLANPFPSELSLGSTEFNVMILEHSIHTIHSSIIICSVIRCVFGCSEMHQLHSPGGYAIYWPKRPALFFSFMRNARPLLPTFEATHEERLPSLSSI